MKNSLNIIITFIMFLLGLFFFIKGYAEVPGADFDKRLITTYLLKPRDTGSTVMKISPSDRREIENKIKRHEIEGTKLFREAESLCVYLPRTSDRELAKNCFVSAMSTIGCVTPSARVVTVVLTMFTQYGLNVIDEYYHITHLLNESAYHFEMAEFYKDLLAKTR